MKKIFYTAFYFCSALLLSSCIGDLDQYPHEDETAASIYTSAEPAPSASAITSGVMSSTSGMSFASGWVWGLAV